VLELYAFIKPSQAQAFFNIQVINHLKLYSIAFFLSSSELYFLRAFARNQLVTSSHNIGAIFFALRVGQLAKANASSVAFSGSIQNVHAE
jgi:hypothetical protein